MTKRLKYIDLAKGLTMLTILWGHVMLSGRTNILVYAFHIPVFFFLSGIVFRKEKYSSVLAFVKRRFLTLLVPYFIFSVATWAFWVLDSYTKGNSLVNCHKPLVETVIARGSAGYMIHNPALWFVTCLFVVELLYYFICKLPTVWNIILCIICALSGWVLMSLEFTVLPWNVEVALAAVIFYSLGNLFGRYGTGIVSFSKKRPYIILLVTAVAAVLLYIGGIWNGHVSMAQCQLGEKSTLVFYLTAISGIVFVISGCLFLEGMYGKLKVLDRLLDYFLWIGRNSFYFMVLHIPCMLVCVRIVASVSGLGIGEVRDAYRYTVPAWIGMMAGSTLLTLLINMLKGKYHGKH